MKIRYIELKNFRNYKNVVLENLSRINVLIGKNGIGKTSIIEAIYLCSVTKTFRSNSDKSMINAESEALKVKIKIEKDDKKKRTLEINLNDDGKKVKINNKLTKKLSEFMSEYKVILFSPDEMKLVKESPNIRRNYLNIELS